MGNYELYLLTGDDVVEKKVLEMRQAGMKIREDCAFRIPMNFTAIFIATGEGAASQDPKDNIMNIQNIFLASRIYSHQLQSVPMPEIRYLCWPHSRS